MNSLQFVVPTIHHGSSAEKENSLSTSSNFSHFLARLSPTKLINLALSPFKRNSNDGTRRESLVADESNSAAAKLLELRRLYTILGEKSAFSRKVAQILRKAATRKGRQARPFSEVRTEPKRRRGAANQRLGPLESAVVRLKHGLSAQFLLNPLPYPFAGHATNGSALQFSADSLTFEFFNTIAPFYPGSAFARFDLFLCALSSKTNEIHCWDHFASFVSAVNHRKRQNQVVEVWVPELGHCCDELLLVVEGHVTGEVVEAKNDAETVPVVPGRRKSFGAKVDKKEQKKVVKARKNSFPTLTVHETPRNENNSKQGGNDKASPNKLPLEGQLVKGVRLALSALSKSAVKQRHSSHHRQTQRASTGREKPPPNGPGAKRRGSNLALSKDSVPAKVLRLRQSVDPEVKPSSTQMAFRGIKPVGKWQSGSGGEKGTFVPMFTHNGIFLNILGSRAGQAMAQNGVHLAEQPLETLLQQLEALVAELKEKNKSCSRGTCHMLQMEVSNEHGYGTNRDQAVQKTAKKASATLPASTIHYTYANSQLANSSDLHLLLNNNPFPASSVLLQCPICPRQFGLFSSLAVHLFSIHPSLSFKFAPVNGERQNETSIQVHNSANYGKPLESENWLLQRKSMRFLRAKMLGAGREVGLEDSEMSKRSAPKRGGLRSVGADFRGQLPVNGPTYTELEDPPFPGLHGVNSDRGWLRDTYKTRLHQFTDVAGREKAFFTHWNTFISVRENRPHGCAHLPKLLGRFVDEYCEVLLRDQLGANFILHCATFVRFGYISGAEMRQVMGRLQQRQEKAGNEAKG